MNVIDIKNFSLSRGKNNQIFHHYTNVDALINIMTEQKLRFTDCMFLNDKEEYNYIFTVVDKCFKDNKELKDILDFSITGIDRKNNKTYIAYNNGFRIKDGRYYILSGCLKSDLLPMWNYYSINSNIYGYSIKFSIDELINSFKDTDADIYKGKVIYDFDKQVRIIERYVKEKCKKTEAIIRKLNKSNEDEYQREFESIWEDTHSDIYEFISFIRLFFKSSSWKYEEEYRIVILAEPDGNLIKKKFKSAKGVVKPYIEVELKKIPITEIKIGPNIEKEVARAGLEELIGNKKIEIKESILLVR